MPSLEDTRARAQRAVAEIKAAADRLLPDLEWVSLHGETGANCVAPYEQSDGKSLYLPDEVAPSADVSDATWVELAAAAKTEAATLGATTTQVMQDGPGNHDVGFYSPTGTYIKIGYQGNLTISSFTGCRFARVA